MTEEIQSKGDRTRQALLEAAIVRFAREGYRGTSVADVCRDARLSTTASYPYFANKEALFVAAVDEDAAGLIERAVPLVADEMQSEHWGRTMVRALVRELEYHPLARRVLSGLEPEFTVRLLEIPALAQIRKAAAELMRGQQLTGHVRLDIDPDTMANGMVLLVISLLMATIQIGSQGFEFGANDIEAVLTAATRPPAQG